MGVSPNDLWRVVRLEVAEDGWISWLHEREWRAPGSFDLPDKLTAVLVKTMGDVERLQNAIAREPNAFWCVPKSVIPLNIMGQGLDY
jgi:hypothetical protein